MPRHIKIEDPEVKAVLERLAKREDFKAQRIKKLLALPDLARTENSPIKFLVDVILALSRFKNLDVISIPDVVTVERNFDILNAPLDHPSRRETDTYYLESEWILRTQMTVMWPFYYSSLEIKKKLETEGAAGALAYGKCYRKDEIDRSHYPIFHQVDGVYITRKDKEIIGVAELREVLIDVAKNIYGPEVEYKFAEDSFPFTTPSLEMAIKWDDRWLEILGAGVVHPQVLKNLGIDPDLYNGWAFGTGIERLAMIKMDIPDIRIFWSTDPRIVGQFRNLESRFKEVSRYPMTYRDISFVVNRETALNNYYEMIRDCGGDLIEEASLSDRYENKEKFGEGKISYTFRIVYRSHERTLTNDEVNKIQAFIEERTKSEFNAVVR